MFRYFPTNYVWNLSVDLAIEMGARIGEIEEMCAPLVEASKKSDAADEDESRGFDPRGEGQDSLFVIRRGSVLYAWGVCTLGPCLGQSLQPVAVELTRDGSIYWQPS